MYGIKITDTDLWLKDLGKDRSMHFIPFSPDVMTWDTEEAAQAFLAANDLYMISLKIVKI